MAMVNMNNLLNGKDSRWLQLEVCREFQRNKCTRPDTECKFAHPPANVEVQNGRVTACYDSIKVRADLCMPQYYMEAVHYKMAESWNQRHRAQCHQLCSEIGSSSLFVCMSSQESCLFAVCVHALCLIETVQGVSSISNVQQRTAEMQLICGQWASCQQLKIYWCDKEVRALLNRIVLSVIQIQLQVLDHWVLKVHLNTTRIFCVTTSQGKMDSVLQFVLKVNAYSS